MKKILLFLMSVFTFVFVYAHDPILTVEDLKNGKILIQGGFSNGESAEDVDLYILKDKPYGGSEETYEGKLVLFKTTFDKTNELEIPKPKASKYVIVFDAGPGHVKEARGPKLTDEEMANWEKLMKEEKIFKEFKEKMMSK
ncbi:hypothetical protein [Caviibacter abscessus]|uniref:hypothetical protein n=1 Tax=Caviibacter abscessus TaxID=1766719 RepID=UPI000830899F|nr:hypothetical protein [Caviibacter abscessus]